jgi:hypothetical protein
MVTSESIVQEEAQHQTQIRMATPCAFQQRPEHQGTACRHISRQQRRSEGLVVDSQASVFKDFVENADQRQHTAVLFVKMTKNRTEEMVMKDGFVSKTCFPDHIRNIHADNY